MSQGLTSPLFICTKEEKMEIMRELGLKESAINEDVDSIVDWFQKQPHLVDAGISRALIERLLLISKGSREQAKRRMDSYYKYRALTPEVFQHREKVLSGSQDLWRTYFQFSLPKLYKGCRVSLVKFLDADPNHFSCESFIMNTFMLCDIRMECDYFIGDIWILDMKHASFGHLLRLNPAIIQKIARLFHEGLNVKIQAIHIINATNVLQPMITFLKQFFSQKIFERVIVHDTIEDLHKHMPKKYLPKDYGGEEPSSLEFKDMYEKELRSTKTKQFLIAASNIISDEMKRLNIEDSEDYLSGSFRKLEFD